MAYKLENINENNFEKILANVKRELEKSGAQFGDSIKLLKDTWAKQTKDINSFVSALKDQNGKVDFKNLLSGGLYNTKKQISSKYDSLRSGIDADPNLSQAQKDYYKKRYNMFEEEEEKEAYENSITGKATKKLSNEFSDGLADMISGYKSFSDVIKDMTGSLTMIKQFTEAISSLLFNEATSTLFNNLLGAGLNMATGGASGALGFISGLFRHHSGGVVPSGANYSLPGTQEQLALLKGGERVLSPSENVNYENSQAASPVIVNSFNIKAWDSKDVRKYLLENKQLLNQITFEGIKNNNAHLRMMVRNA
ncbi:MAG: hypothetical protein KH321_09605 [Clostridium sp.]|nr:hypothetical protein [Clostridium sp.]